MVHSLVEARPELRFVLTGSSARKLRHGAATLLGFQLRVFQCRAQRQRVQPRKFFFFDAGVFRSLRALCQLRANGTQLSFWRTRAGLEVNFVVHGPNLFKAIQVKRAAKVTSADLKGLKAFQADYLEAQHLLLPLVHDPIATHAQPTQALECALER